MGFSSQYLYSLTTNLLTSSSSLCWFSSVRHISHPNTGHHQTPDQDMSTENDRDVLNSLLNPNLPLGEGVFDPEQQAPQSLAEAAYEDQNVKELESRAVKAAEEGYLSKALELFDEV